MAAANLRSTPRRSAQRRGRAGARPSGNGPGMALRDAKPSTRRRGDAVDGEAADVRRAVLPAAAREASEGVASSVTLAEFRDSEGQR